LDELEKIYLWGVQVYGPTLLQQEQFSHEGEEKVDPLRFYRRKQDEDFESSRATVTFEAA
jgi:hypothetical protein